jgi:hypothetical protein
VLKYAALEMLDAWRQPSGGAGISRLAHRVAFHYDPRPGYLYVRSRMISSRTNDNHDTFPAGEIEKGYKTFLGKPVFVNHNNANHRRARGVIVAVALHRDKTRDGKADTWVEGLMEVDAVRFPKLAKAILEGKVNRTSMGVDVDWSTCSACGNKATSPAEYCKHLPAMKGRKIRQRNKKTGKVEERLIHEICAGLSFFENSLLVEDPADPTAVLIGKPDARGMAKAASLRTASSGDPDFRDHIPSSCRSSGDPVAFLPASRNGKYPDRWRHDTSRAQFLYDHEADPALPELRNPRMSPSTFGGTRCAVCGEDVKINLHSLGTPTGGWHHHDGMLRDHPAVPLDPQAVYDSVPGARASMDQARQQVREHMHRQFEQLEGRPLPRAPRGDEDRMPPDPFTARRKRPRRQAAADPGRRWPESSDRCAGCRAPLGDKDDPMSARSPVVPSLCTWCGSRSAGYPDHVQNPDLMGEGQREFTPGDYLPPSFSSRRVAYGETRVPPQVDTLRMDECPVCGEHNVWSGSRCPVCGFVVPPSVFRDPDTDKARQVRDQLDDTGEVTEDPQDPQDQEMGEEEQIGSGDDADDQLTHPDQIAPDGVPIVQGEGGPVPGEEDDGQEEGQPPPEDEEEGEPGEIPDGGDEDGDEGGLPEDDGEEPGDELECPACGTTFETDAYAQPGMPCPACGMANLHPIDEDGVDGGEFPPGEEDDEDPDGDEEGDGPQKDQEDDPSAPGDEKEEDEDMPASKTGAALAQAQARRIAELSAQNEALSAQLRFLASAAGVERELAEVGRRVMRRHADVMNPASPVPDPPEGPPSETTEQALMPEAMDDPSRPGATPGANSRVPAAQTTTAITPGVEMQTPPATNLVDVTAPVQGTNPSQDGGVPIEQRRIETDVRVDPDPLKAHGPGIGGQGDNGAAFPWVLDARMPDQGGQPGQGQRAASLRPQQGEAESARRTFASIRLARLRVHAGLAQGDELSVAERIERDASLSTAMIEHDISTLEQVGAMARPQAPVQRQAARATPSLASVGASQYAPAVAMDDDGSDIFL